MQDILKMVYHSNFHSVITYKIIFWGNSSHSNSVFKLQKRIIKIIMGVGIKDSCRKLFKMLTILPLLLQYIFSLALFVVTNEDQFRMNSEIHSIRIKNKSDFFQPLSHLTMY
jgi:hypothetical protein